MVLSPSFNIRRTAGIIKQIGEEKGKCGWEERGGAGCRFTVSLCECFITFVFFICIIGRSIIFLN